MNAYELAKYIEDDIQIQEGIADMLRQQADLIRNLQKSLGFKNSGYETINLTPQTKPLSDEEILNVAFCCEVNTVAIENDWDGTVIDFARAILKKASEK